MEVIYDWIKNIVMFLILAKILEYLIPNGNMKKYVKLFTGVLLMLIILNPVIKYSGLSNKLNYNIIMRDFELKTPSVEEQINQNKDLKNDITIKLYKEKIVSHIMQLLTNEDINVSRVNVDVVEDYNSDNYGALTRVVVTISEKQVDKPGDIRIQKVETITIEDKQSTTNQEVKSSEQIILEKNIKNMINNFYNLSSDNIYITIES